MCRWCGRKCKGEFCDEVCAAEHKEEEAIMLESRKEDYPTESRYSWESFYEPPERDVVGGL